MGFDWQNFLLGGQGSTPGDYATPYQDRSQILGYVNQGMAGANAAAPQMDPTQQAQFRQMQMAQAQQLQGIASGQQQGAGELAVQRQVANAQAAQQAQARMARGGGAGMAGMMAARQQAGIGLQGAGQAQQAALSDQQMAQGQLSGALNQGRQGDLSMSSQNANLQQQQYGLNTQRQMGYMGQLSGMDQNQLNAQMSAYGAAQGNKGALGQLVSSGGQVATAAATPAAVVASDERLKTDVTSAGRAIDEMLSKLCAKTYRYKDETKYGKGERTGIMVQDLEKSKAGKALVVELPDGNMKGFDVNKAISVAIASAARLDERLRRLEGKR